MGWETEIEYIESRFTTNWGVTTPIRYGNDPRPAPTTGEWVSLHVIPIDATRSTLGIRNHRYNGIININIFVAKGTGTNRCRALADTASAIFRDIEFNNIVCRSPNITVVGDNDGFYQINVSVPYWKDEIFT